MKNAILFTYVSLAASAFAFPAMLKEYGTDNLAQFEAKIKRARSVNGPVPQIKQQKRQSGNQLPISIPLPAITVPGLPLPTSIDLPYISSVGTKIIPDSSHSFQAPGPTDQRGGCPGLNIMSNYGYMDRSGVVGAGELIYAMMQMLGYSQDLSQVLIALAIRSGAMDITTLKMSIGGKDSRTNGPLSSVLGSVPGLFDYAAHNRYEIDGSMAYEDAYFGNQVVSNGFNAGGQFNGTRFAAMQAIADSQTGGLYNVQLHQAHRYAAYQECIATNPTCTWNAIGELLFYGADCYTFLGMASTDPTTSQIRDPDSASIQSFFGAQKSGNTFVQVPEQLHPGPEGVWYRRSTPLTTAEIAGTISSTYGAHPVVFGANDGKNVNTFSPSTTQFSGDGAGAMCLILSTISENDGVLGQNYGVAASFALATIQALISPAVSSLGCGGLAN